MSADNYILVGKNADGRFEISHRCASIYYADEVTEAPMEGYAFEGNNKGWTIRGDSKNRDVIFQTMEDAEKAATRRPDWIEPAPTPQAVFDDVNDAMKFAYKFMSGMGVCEYGVKLSPEAQAAFTEEVK